MNDPNVPAVKVQLVTKEPAVERFEPKKATINLEDLLLSNQYRIHNKCLFCKGKHNIEEYCTQRKKYCMKSLCWSCLLLRHYGACDLVTGMTWDLYDDEEVILEVNSDSK